MTKKWTIPPRFRAEHGVSEFSGPPLRERSPAADHTPHLASQSPGMQGITHPAGRIPIYKTRARFIANHHVMRTDSVCTEALTSIQQISNARTVSHSPSLGPFRGRFDAGAIAELLRFVNK